MNKIIASTTAAAVLLGASIVSAQSFYGYGTTYGYDTTYGQNCIALSSNLSLGSRSSEVQTLQSFLVGQNYPGGGSWMITGYYGAATQAAVRLFQQQRGLPQTGSVDTATRAAINQASCLPGQGGGYVGGVGYTGTYAPSYTYNPFTYNQSYPSYAYNYNTGYPYSSYNQYGYNYPYNSYGSCGTFPNYYQCTGVGSVTLTSLSPTSGTIGTQVTLIGTGFDYANNNVYIGGTTLRNIPSYNGTMLSFTVPSNITGTVSISVGNSRGTSNALTFQAAGVPTTYPYTYPYNYGYNYGCASGYNYGYCPPSGAISLNYLSPQSGAVGATVTVYGGGFSSTGNTVHFGNGIIANLRSFDGTSLSFVVPSQLSGYGYQPIGLGTYEVSVTNSYGATSNTLPFTVTALGTSGYLNITSVNGPTSLAVGQTGTWTVNMTSQTGTQLTASVQWGDENLYGYSLSAPQNIYTTGSNTVTFTHAYQNSGTYTITFTIRNQFGQQNTSTMTVNVSGTSSGTVQLNSLTPTSGTVGTTITIFGSGFTGSNAVHFGQGGSSNIPSINGTTIYYTVPQWTSTCPPTTQICTAQAIQVTPGIYPVKVSNQNGTSQTLNFTVI